MSAYSSLRCWLCVEVLANIIWKLQVHVHAVHKELHAESVRKYEISKLRLKLQHCSCLNVKTIMMSIFISRRHLLWSTPTPHRHRRRSYLIICLLFRQSIKCIDVLPFWLIPPVRSHFTVNKIKNIQWCLESMWNLGKQLLNNLNVCLCRRFIISWMIQHKTRGYKTKVEGSRLIDLEVKTNEWKSVRGSMGDIT